jgi:hypothetical protein
MLIAHRQYLPDQFRPDTRHSQRPRSYRTGASGDYAKTWNPEDVPQRRNDVRFTEVPFPGRVTS